jgi:hypothetical protein
MDSLTSVSAYLTSPTDCKPLSHNRRDGSMIRLLTVLLLLVVGGCADRSRGTALNECRTRYDIRSYVDQNQLIPGCMQEKSFTFASPCPNPPDENVWDPKVKTFAYDNPECYRPVGSERWIATGLSPM